MKMKMQLKTIGVFLSLLVLLFVGSSLSFAQDNQPSKDQILRVVDGLNPETSGVLQIAVVKLAATGNYRASVMAAASGQPSDHKVWVNGAAWTWISSDSFKAGTFRWDPYLQVPYDGSGINACGMPLSAGQTCVAVSEPSCPPHCVPPPPAPPVDPAPPVETGLRQVVDAMASALVQMNRRVDALEDLLNAVSGRVGSLEQRPVPLIPTACIAAINLGATRIPLSCKLQ